MPVNKLCRRGEKISEKRLLDEVQELPVCTFSSRRIVSITLVILWLVGSGIHPVSANDEVTLYLQWYHQFQFAGYYAAQEKGFFREEGLEVTIVEGGPGTENFKAVLSAPGRYGTAHAAGLLLHRANGEPLIALASVFQHSPNAIIARADRGIRHLHDLVAERTVIWPGGHVELSAMFLNEGINPAPFLHDINGNHLQELLDGKIDAIDGYITNEAITLREAGIPIVVILPINYGVDFYGDVLMTSERELREHPDRAKAFRAASLLGWKYAMEHTQEIVELIVSEYSAKPTREHLLSEAEAIKPFVLNSLIKIGHTNPGRWQKMADTLAVLGMAKPGIQAEDFLFDPNPNTDLAKLHIGLRIASAVTAIITLFASVLLHLNRRLRREIFERKRAEEQIKASLKEKEVLLSEIHHRVKNNMQVMISLLRLQADKIEDKKYADILKEGEDRIRSMALIHEQLFQSKDLVNINFREYVKTLSRELFRSYAVDPNIMKLSVEIDDNAFGIENAIPCGLIINELVSNSLKYAFPRGKEGKISVDLRSISEDELELIVSDDGIGIPEEVDIRNTDTIGLSMVRMLAEHRLNGKITLNRTKGPNLLSKLKELHLNQGDEPWRKHKS